jgi:hypothetical protein
VASIVRGTLNSRYNASIRFPEGSAPNLHQGPFPGVVKPLDRIDVPERAFLWSDHKALADFVAINAKTAVCPEVKEAIEALEPGRHQCFAVEIVRGSGRKPIFRLDGRELATPYYLFNSSVRLDAVWIEKSEVRIASNPKRLTLVFPLPGKKDRVVLRRDIVSGHHVWTGAWQLPDSMFFSDQLMRIVIERKWKGLEFVNLREE